MRNDLDLDVLKILLEKRLAEIMAGREAQQREGAPVELDQTKVGRLSRMDALQQQAMAQASARRTEVELQRIRTAISRLHSGDYGFCVKCDEEIAERRLKIDPATLTASSARARWKRRTVNGEKPSAPDHPGDDHSQNGWSRATWPETGPS